jgi:hypothetical protein
MRPDARAIDGKEFQALAPPKKGLLCKNLPLKIAQQIESGLLKF